MGWKTLKQHFNISHTVQLTPTRVLIGSGYVQDLVSIDRDTGAVKEHSTFGGFLAQHYPALASAEPTHILALLAAPDVFAADLPVFTYTGAQIIEKRCEALGWPNVTHDGDLMYENTHFADKASAIARARESAESGLRFCQEAIARKERELATLRADLTHAQAVLADLDGVAVAPVPSPTEGA